MLPEKTIHFVDGEQLSDKQYASYRERLRYVEGKKVGIREVVEWLSQNTFDLSLLSSASANGLGFDKGDWQAKLKEWGIDA